MHKRLLGELEIMAQIDARLGASGRAMARRRLEAVALVAPTAQATVTSCNTNHTITSGRSSVAIVGFEGGSRERSHSLPSRIRSQHKLRRKRRKRLSSRVRGKLNAEGSDDGSSVSGHNTTAVDSGADSRGGQGVRGGSTAEVLGAEDRVLETEDSTATAKEAYSGWTRTHRQRAASATRQG